MPLGKTSQERLSQCTEELQILIQLVALGIDAGDLAHAGVHDISVQTGHRGQAEQEAAFARGDSKVHWPHGAHNSLPSKAADVVPYPELWSDLAKCRALNAYIVGMARARGIRLHSISWDPAHIEPEEKENAHGSD